MFEAPSLLRRTIEAMLPSFLFSLHNLKALSCKTGPRGLLFPGCRRNRLRRRAPQRVPPNISGRSALRHRCCGIHLGVPAPVSLLGGRGGGNECAGRDGGRRGGWSGGNGSGSGCRKCTHQAQQQRPRGTLATGAPGRLGLFGGARKGWTSRGAGGCTRGDGDRSPTARRRCIPKPLRRHFIIWPYGAFLKGAVDMSAVAFRDMWHSPVTAFIVES